MTTQNDNGLMTFVAGEALAQHTLVRLSSTNDRTVVYTDSGEIPIGVVQEAVASGGVANVKLLSSGGTFKMTASEAIATRNCRVYPADDGKVKDTAAGNAIGYALDTASAIGGIIEVCPIARGQESDILALATIDDDSGGTTSGTEQLALSSSAIDDDTGGTTSGTEQLNAVTGTGGSAGHAALINNNLAVLAAEFNQLRTDLANNVAVLADRINAIIGAAG